MNKFLVFAAILATALARPDGLLHGQDGHVSVQQNTLGTYKYNVHLADGVRSEERFADGSVIGEYTLLGANGLPQTIRYTSGKDGFRILEGPVPVAPVHNGITLLPVQELPHLASGPLPSELVLPVQDTPEVRAAKIAFFNAYKQATARTA